MGIKMGTPPTITAEPLGPPGLAGSLAINGDPTGVAFNNNGTSLFVEDWTPGDVLQYNLSNDFDITTASLTASLSTNSQEPKVWGMAFNPNGTRLFITGTSNDTAYQYNLTTAFDVSTASFSGKSFNVSSQITNLNGVAFNNNGTRMFISGFGNNSIYQYSLTTGFDLSTVSFSGGSFNVNPEGLAFNNNGTRLFTLGKSPSRILQYNLTTAFDITTASFSGKSFDLSSEMSNPNGLAFNDTGVRVAVAAESPNSVFQYNLTAPFDLS